MKKQIILASASPRRQELLKSLGISFKVVPSNLKELQMDGEVPARAAVRLAQAKALAVARRFPKAVVLAADTIVLLGKEVLGKPKSLAEAGRMIEKLSGRTHLVITGFCLIKPDDNRVIKKAVFTKVKMKRVSRAELKGYLRSGEPLDKAGAYAVQEILHGLSPAGWPWQPRRRRPELDRAAAFQIVYPPIHRESQRSSR